MPSRSAPLEAHADRVPLLAATLRELATASSPDEGAMIIAQKVCELDGWDSASVSVVVDGSSPRVLACWPPTDDTAAVAGRASEWSGQPEALTRLDDAVRREGLARVAMLDGNGHGLVDVADACDSSCRVAAVFPLSIEGRCVGTIRLYSREHRRVDTELEETMEHLAAQVGQLLIRERLERALEADEKRFLGVAQSADVTLYEQDRNLRYTWVCPAGAPGVCQVGETDSERTPDGKLNPLAALKREALRKGEDCRREVRVREGNVSRLLDVVVNIRRDPAGGIEGVAGTVVDITQQRRSHEASHWLAAIVESCDEAIISKGLDGVITSWNQGATRLFGYQPDEVIGRSVLILIPHNRHGEEAHILGRICRGERVERFETMRYRKDGSMREVSLTVSPVRDNQGRIIGASKVVRDITAERRAERQQKALYELVATVNRAAAPAVVFEAALDAICRCQSADRAAILLTNKDGTLRFVAVRGLSEHYQRAVTHLGPRVVREEDARAVAFDDVIEGGLPEPLRSPVVNEGIRALASVPFFGGNRLMGWCVFAYDQPRRFAADELRPAETIAGQVAFAIERQRYASELESLIEQRTASLRGAIAQMEEFSYSVSHDLRAPLRAMQGYAAALMEDHAAGLNGEAHEYLRRIVSASERMDRLILDTLTYSRINASPVELQPVSLDRLITEILQHYPEMQPPRARVVVPEPLPDVRAHEPSLTQALSNLLSNAIKFVAPGVRPVVTVCAECRDGWVRLRVQDNGIGVGREHQARIFGMFERVHPANKFEGTGIGLAIVRKAVERMGGEVGVESDGVHGSCFWMDLAAC